MRSKQEKKRELHADLLYWIITGVIILLIIWLAGCRCVRLQVGEMEVCGCSLLSDTGFEDTVINPNQIKSGLYRGSTDSLKLITPYGTLRSE